MNAITKIEPRQIAPNYGMADLERMAIAFARSGLFGAKTPDQALALCLIAQAEGKHPALASKQYHIINGSPAKKADAMLGDFQAMGGKVDWHEYTDACVSGTFSHPDGGSVRVDWDDARVSRAQINNPNHKKYPRAMKRARCISEGVRTVYPGATSGMYAPEEIQDGGVLIAERDAPAPLSGAMLLEQAAPEVAATPEPTTPRQTPAEWAADYIAKVQSADALEALAELQVRWAKALASMADKHADVSAQIDEATRGRLSELAAGDGFGEEEA